MVEGAGPFNQVVDRKIFYPPDDSPVEDIDGEDEIWNVLGLRACFCLVWIFGFHAYICNYLNSADLRGRHL